MNRIITAQNGKVFIQKSTGFNMGKEVSLGIDYSTGIGRLDLPEYYEQIVIPFDETENGEENI